MSDVFEKLAACRAAFPEDIEKVEADEARVRDLLAMKAYATLPETRTLIGMCRSQIVVARKKLATVREMSGDVRDGLWLIIEGREWVIRTLARDFDAELAQIERELEAELARP